MLPQKISAQKAQDGGIKIKTDTENDTQNIDTGKKAIGKKPEQSKPLAVNADQEKKASTGLGKQLSESEIKAEKPAKNQPDEISANDLNNEDLMEALMCSSKTKQKTSEIKPKETAKAEVTEIEGLFSKAQKPTGGDQSGRAELILNRLKKLPKKYLEGRQGGITKVIGIGLKNTKLDLNDCVSVMKSADLLVLIDGYETALDSTGKPKSRYFLVKADLLNGK